MNGLFVHLQAESTGPLGTLQDEQTRLKAEYDRMEVLSSPLLVSGLSGGTKQSLEWPASPLMAAHDDQRLQACVMLPYKGKNSSRPNRCALPAGTVILVVRPSMPDEGPRILCAVAWTGWHGEGARVQGWAHWVCRPS